MQLRILTYILGAVLAAPSSAFALSFTCANTQQSFTNPSAAGTTTGPIQSFAVPAGVTSITIDAAGAQGGAGTVSGGLGAEVTTTASVTPGQTLCVVVGVQGGLDAGGGGSFVFAIASGTCASAVGSVTAGASPPNLLVAAGGGGGGSDTAGLDGVAPNDAGTGGASAGTAGDQAGAGAGGVGGNGGAGGSFAGGGGGLSTNGLTGTPNGQGGFALINGATGGTDPSGQNGGFGGGGALGAGGGYNGGGGGGQFAGGFGGSGGGGSYSISSLIAANTQSGVQPGNGAVNLCYLATTPVRLQSFDVK